VKSRVAGHLISLLLGGLIFSSAAYAAGINVDFLPLKFFVNGEEKTTLSGQPAFIYNGRTYVPLRFLAESLGCGVDWDRETSSIYMTITPDDIPNLPKSDEQIVSFTGVWRTESGSIYSLQQNGTSVTGTFTHYTGPSDYDDKSDYTNLRNMDKPKYEFPLTGSMDDKTVELTWVYNNPKVYANIKDVPLRVGQQVAGISETVILTLNQESKDLEGYYYQNYVEWDPNKNQVIEKADGNSQMANSKLSPLKVKLFFNDPI